MAFKAKNCECNFRTLGLGAGNGRVVDREIQRESLLCPDYLKVPRQQQQQQQQQYYFRLQKGKEGVKRVKRGRQRIMRESRWEEKDRTGKLIEMQKLILSLDIHFKCSGGRRRGICGEEEEKAEG